MIYNEKLQASGPLGWLFIALAVVVGIIGWASGILAVADASLKTWEKLTLFALLNVAVGTLLAGWLATLSVRVRVDASTVSVSLWPLSKTVVERSTIKEIEQVSIDPLKDYGGWGIKGKSADKLYGMSGNSGVRVHHSGGKLTVLAEQPDGLLEALQIDGANPEESKESLSG